MARRRGHGEGSITQRADGRWMGRVDIGRGASGGRRRKYVYAATERYLIAKMKRLHGRSATGQLLTTSTPTVAAFLEDWFATNRAWKARLAAATAARSTDTSCPPSGRSGSSS